MRVYLPGTLPLLARVVEEKEVGPPPLVAYAVTPALYEWYGSDDIEELEYAAMTEAARASLGLLDADPTAPRRRVVIAAEVPEHAVGVGDPHRGSEGRAGVGGSQSERGGVLLSAAVPYDRIASAHVDDPGAEGDVAAAVGALRAAERGDADARVAVHGVQVHELLWYARQEITDLAG